MDTDTTERDVLLINTDFHYTTASAPENEALLKVTDAKYEVNYFRMQNVMKRSMVLLLIVLLTVVIMDIVHLSLRLGVYQVGDGNMLPQAIIYSVLATYVAVFTIRPKSYRNLLPIVVYITVLTLFSLFSLALLPSFVKEILIDFDPLCPVLIALTGASFLASAINIYHSYKFLKALIKYKRYKANLPAVLHASPRNSLDPCDESIRTQLLFPSPPPTFQPPINGDLPSREEQWAQFLRSRAQAHAQAQQPPSPPPEQAAALDPQRADAHGVAHDDAQAQWERLQKSRLYMPEPPAQPPAPPAQQHASQSLSRTSSQERVAHHTGSQRFPRSASEEQVPQHHAPKPTRALSRSASHERMPPRREDADTHYPPVAPVRPELHPPRVPPHATAQDPPARTPTLRRNPSFKYGAYVHEPKQFVAHISPTPQEYQPRSRDSHEPRYASAHTTPERQPRARTRSESLPNINLDDDTRTTMRAAARKPELLGTTEHAQDYVSAPHERGDRENEHTKDDESAPP